jgi:hypothetical protein
MVNANDNVNRPWPELPPKSRGPYVRLKESLSASWARRPLKAIGLLALVVAALIGVLAVILFVTRTHSLDTATYPGAIQRLTIDTDTGEVSVVGSDRADVLVLWQRRYSLIKPRVDRGLRDGALQLRSRCPGVSFRCAVVLGSQVPGATATSIRTRSATVDMQDLGGPVEPRLRNAATPPLLKQTCHGRAGAAVGRASADAPHHQPAVASTRETQ